MTAAVTHSGLRLHPVVVTAMAVTSSVGGDLETTWSGLLDGRSGIATLTDEWVERLDLPVRIAGRLAADPTESLKKVEKRRLDYIEQLALVLGRDVWARAGSPAVEAERLGVAVGTGMGGIETLLENTAKLEAEGYRKVSPIAVPAIMPNGPAATIGLEIGAKAGVHTPVSACASGSEAIAMAWRMIAMGEADVMVTGGVENRISALPIASFAMMRATSFRNDDPEAASRPFDRDRDGFVFGEAAAMLVLEREDHARARGATILGRVLGAGTTSDGFHIVAPDPEGSGAARAMSKAIEYAGIAPGDVAHVNAHATSTSVGDLAEAKAIQAAVGGHPSVYAPKSALGHSIGAVGALEAALTVMSLREGVIPPTLNLENQDPEVDLDVVAGGPRTGTFDAAISNSFGFGGHNVSLAFGRA
ncbi:KasA/KasB family beta-ketoacyl-ACP synthase [Tomitella gaofuii]|uniref:KasA/KasB family beta-ketoacyl-ACP synthase n=1 Tax=Tomitella gaofuii TaxID=2760083 RepID=UPI0015FE1855|nr:KasA/KasB family beta-ketoacyl-ACP synthase [Tomitella gaofuii]